MYPEMHPPPPSIFIYDREILQNYGPYAPSANFRADSSSLATDSFEQDSV